jgi:type II secretory ATPase GspE/PulE/Tfp pilus assembly ATPase PilB-like protein
VQAALTGHLVLATLHTNDAPGAVARLLDMNIEPYLLSSALNGRRRAAAGADDLPGLRDEVLPDRAGAARRRAADKANRAFRKGAGCQQCHDSGFQGRFGIYEVMEVTPEIPQHDPQGGARRTSCGRSSANRAGGTLREAGRAVGGRGAQPVLDEVLRVTHNEDAEVPVKVARRKQHDE